MSIFAVLIAALVASVHTLGVLDDTSATGLVAAILAVAVVLLAAHPSHVIDRFAALLQPNLLVVILIPFFWMLLQAIPMPLDGLSNAAWTAASSALNRPIVGSITVDVGATLISCVEYAAILAASLVVATAALDRQSARIILHLLVALVTLTVLFQIASDLGFLAFLDRVSSGNRATGRAAIGAVLSCAAILNERDRLAGRKDRPEPLGLALGGLSVAFAICLAVIFFDGERAPVFAALLGASLPVAVFIIKTWRFEIWGKAGVAAVITTAAFSLFAAAPVKDNGPATTLVQSNQVAVERMLSDAPSFGSGARSFDAIMPIYRDVGEQSFPQTRPAATTIIIEMGLTFFWGLMLVLISCAFVLVARSLARRRDYVYAAAGAGTIVTYCIMMFINGEPLNLATLLITGAVGGLALAQSHSRSESAVVAMRGLRRNWIRSAFLSFGLLLAAEALWILVPEYFSSRSAFLLSSDLKSPALTFENRKNLESAAMIGIVRGNLWSDSALADASALLKSSSADADLLRPMQESLIHALRYVPYRSDVWLMLAALGERNQPPHYEPKSLLRMAYYTGPNEVNLIPFRIKVALALTGAATDPELRDMLKRDLTIALVRLPVLKPSIAAAYKSATPEGKALADLIVAETDPSFLPIMHRP